MRPKNALRSADQTRFPGVSDVLELAMRNRPEED